MLRATTEPILYDLCTFVYVFMKEERMQIDPISQQIYAYYTVGVATDSRKVAAGMIFFGLPGEKVNGGEFAEAALAQGATLAVVDLPALGGIPGVVVVKDVVRTLVEVAYLHRQTLHCPLLAVTGTNGKTTTKELLRAVLSSRYRVAATEGNYNNLIGVPLTLLGIPRDTEVAIVEMGANHPGEIAQLCEIAEPTHGLITSVGEAHLEGFGSIEGVAHTKSELFAYLKAHNGLGFVREDDPWVAQEAERVHLGCSASKYSLAGYQVQTQLMPTGTLALRLMWQRQSFSCKTQLVGSFNAINVLAALHVGHYFNVPLEEACQALEAYRPQLHRSQLLDTKRNRLIVDCYNANPTSMRLAIESFFQLPCQGKRLLILGEMRELGDATQTAHRDVQAQLLHYADYEVWYVGAAWEKEHRALYFVTSEECIRHLQLGHYSGGLVLLKGSHSVGLDTLIPYL